MGKIHPTFIGNDKNMGLYMMDVAADISRPILKINIIVWFLGEPLNSSSPQPANLKAVGDDLVEH